MKLPVICCVILCCWSSMVAAAKSEDCMDWHENPTLSWDDFNGSVVESSPFAAMTHWYIYYRWKGNIVTAESCFETEKSWVREDKETNYLLQHEQLHFDIAQLHARLFKRNIESATSIAQVKKVFNQVLEAAREMQAQYDEETKHSRDKAAQRRWNKSIVNQLDELSDYDFDTQITLNIEKSKTKSR